MEVLLAIKIGMKEPVFASAGVAKESRDIWQIAAIETTEPYDKGRKVTDGGWRMKSAKPSLISLTLSLSLHITPQKNANLTPPLELKCLIPIGS